MKTHYRKIPLLFLLVTPCCTPTSSTGTSQGASFVSPSQTDFATAAESGTGMAMGGGGSTGTQTSTHSVFYGKGQDLLANPIQLQGYLLPAADASSTKGIIAIPGRLGLTKAFEENLAFFAQNGYSVLAVNLFNQIPVSLSDGTAMERELASQGIPTILANIEQGRAFLIQRFQLAQVSVVGWDTGGRWAVITALTAAGHYVAAASYAGDITATLQQFSATNISIPIFGVFSVEDTSISASAIATLGGALQSQNVPFTFQLVGGVQGNFMDPTSPTYDATQSMAMLQKTLTLFPK